MSKNTTFTAQKTIFLKTKQNDKIQKYHHNHLASTN